MKSEGPVLNGMKWKESSTKYGEIMASMASEKFMTINNILWQYIIRYINNIMIWDN